MIINGYDTTVGNAFRVSEQVENTIKMLSTTSRLEKVNTRGVYGIDFNNGENFPTFIFPITVENYRREKITVIDQRNYFNKSGGLVNSAEYTMIEIAASLQQAAANNDLVVLKTVRPFVAKAMAKSLGNILKRRGNLDLVNHMTVEVMLIHYYNCLLTPATEDVTFITQNVVKSALNYPDSFVLSVIEQTGRINNLKELLSALKTYPSLFSLQKLDMGGLVSMINQTWMVLSRYNQILGGAFELPHLFTAICYVSVTERVYQKTEIGQALDKKYNPSIGSFIDTINHFTK